MCALTRHICHTQRSNHVNIIHQQQDEPAFEHLPPDLCQAVWRQLRDVCEVPKLWVIRVHCDDLVILLPLIQHLHDADGLGAQEAHGHHWLLHQHQDIQRVRILAQRLGDEPVGLPEEMGWQCQLICGMIA